VGKRISHSLLDRWLTRPVKARYEWFHLPRRLPPEAIVVSGHVCAIAAAVGFAFSGRFWWGGVLAATGVACNHLADVLDGTHARRTGQCRNGGELLDHFLDPLSFAYYLAGICIAARRLDLAVAAVICLYATAVLTNIKAKLIGEFTLSRFGPTEFKTLLVIFGLVQTGLLLAPAPPAAPVWAATWFISVLLAVGVVQLLVNLVRAVVEVNRRGTAPDTTEWEMPEGRPPAACEVARDE
jgi:phosphatidylglycerophosphate synthase